MLRDALDRGIRDISVAIGGSATNDGGMGCLSALGIRFFDRDGNLLEGRGEDLEKVHGIDRENLDPRVKETGLTVMCDVTNPLTGPIGATMTYGKQKGGTPEMLERLEEGMCNFREVVLRETGVDADKIPGSGAAGGLGAALAIFLGGRMRSGIETVLDLVHFKERLSGVDLVITGEGCADRQSCYGKVMQGIGQQARTLHIPVIGLCGSLGEGHEELLKFGITTLLTTTITWVPWEEIMSRAEEFYFEGAVRMFEMIRTDAGFPV
jgi:glycerate kinase